MLNKDDLRNARLKALGLISDSIPLLGHGSLNDSIANISDQQIQQNDSGHSGKKRYRNPISRTMSNDTLLLVRQCAYGNGGAVEDDIHRWYTQGFVFCSSIKFGLKQDNGGPCGILAAVQAEILSLLCFTETSEGVENLCDEVLPSPNESQMDMIFAKACANILVRAATSEIDGGSLVNQTVVVYVIDCPSTILSPGTISSELLVYEMSSFDDVCEFIYQHLDLFRSTAGCMIFLISLILSR